jgi:hypothetical protein
MPILNRIPKPRAFKDFDEPDAFKIWMRGALILAVTVCVIGLCVCMVMDGCGKRTPADGQPKPPPAADEKKPPAPPPDLHNPVRPAPKSFPLDSNLPRGKESLASGPIDLKTFSPTNDLIRFEDARVWFESDSDHHSDDEDDHVIHRSVEVPLKRLVNLLEKKGGKLKVHEAYRAAEKNKIHLATSLHCEGRAVDLTCEKYDLGEFAKLAWQSGFDFVLYEKPRRSGVHLHCSAKRSPGEPPPPRSDKARPAQDAAPN